MPNHVFILTAVFVGALSLGVVASADDPGPESESLADIVQGTLLERIDVTLTYRYGVREIHHCFGGTEFDPGREMIFRDRLTGKQIDHVLRLFANLLPFQANSLDDLDHSFCHIVIHDADLSRTEVELFEATDESVIVRIGARYFRRSSRPELEAVIVFDYLLALLPQPQGVDTLVDDSPDRTWPLPLDLGLGVRWNYLMERERTLFRQRWRWQSSDFILKQFYAIPDSTDPRQAGEDP